MPSIGYGSNKKTRHMLPDGFRKFLVHNVAVRSVSIFDRFTLFTWFCLSAITTIGSGRGLQA